MLLHPLPAGEEASRPYNVTLNGIPVELYSARVSAVPLWPGHQRPLDQTDSSAFLSCETDEPLRVRVEASRDFRKQVERPLCRYVRPTANGKQAEFTIERAGHYTPELDGLHQALHLFVNPPERGGVDPADPSTLSFGPGVHSPGIIDMHDNQAVYLAAGAVVHVSIRAVGKTSASRTYASTESASQRCRMPE